MNILDVPVAKLSPAEYNPRAITAKERSDISNSIKEFGFVEPLVVNLNENRKNIIIGGHQRFSIAQELGHKTVPVFYINCNEEEEKRLNIRLNKNLGHWDYDLLAEFDKCFLFDLGFSEDELEISFPTEEPEIVEDDVPEPPRVAKSKLGDIYILGEHRLMCGDSTQIADVERLMDGQKADMVLTDPPYNTGMEAKNDSTWLSHMFKDKFTDEDWDEFLKNIFANYFISTKGEAAFYIFIDWRRVGDIKSVVEKTIPVTNVIVWDKVVHGLGSDYKHTYELIIVAKKGKPKINNRIDKEYQDVWHLQRTMGRNENHATAKPIALCSKPVTHASKQDDTVLDLFGGSGSTLIACEQLNRKCYMMEIDPLCIDVIIKRWENLTNNSAIKVKN